MRHRPGREASEKKGDAIGKRAASPKLLRPDEDRRLIKNLTIRDRIVGTFGIVLLTMIAVGAFAYVHLTTIERQAEAMETRVLTRLEASSQIREGISDHYAMTVRLLSGVDPATRARVEALMRAEQAHLDQQMARYEATIDSDGHRRVFEQLSQRIDEYHAAQARVFADGEVVSDPRVVSARLARLLDPQVERAAAAIDVITEDSRRQGSAVTARIHDLIHQLRTSILICFSIALIVGVLGGVWLLNAVTRPLRQLIGLMDAMRQGDFTQRMAIDRRDEIGDLAEGFNRMADEVMGLVGQVQKSGIRVSTSMTEIAATSKQQQATASEVAATTTQIGATSREISATSKELVRTMNEVSTVAEHAASLAGSGQTGLSHMEETMGHVMEAAASINAKLAVLNEKAGNINQVVTTITKVADQTNLLSLNAAIEAEKAGEYGRGFAVVSSEIRRLADQTAVATYDIEQMVKDIQSAVSAGVMGMDKFSEEVRRGLHDVHEIGGKLSEIISQVQALVPRFETVNEGMQAQATGAEQISEALLQLTESTQQTVESLRQSSGAIDELNTVSSNLHGSISRFKLAAG